MSTATSRLLDPATAALMAEVEGASDDVYSSAADTTHPLFARHQLAVDLEAGASNGHSADDSRHDRLVAEVHAAVQDLHLCRLQVTRGGGSR